jgi:zona occludens toxin (predicted ATPase)
LQEGVSVPYRGNQYRYISIIDIDYKNRYLQQEEGSYRLSNTTYLVMSLGECYDRDNCHYKLIATIIEKDSQ